MPKVFMPQMPSRFDVRLRCWIPTINATSAEQFGELEIVLPPDAGRMGQKALADAAFAQMHNFCEEDYLMCVGDPVVLSLCAIAAANNVEKIKFLRWDRMSNSYNKIEVEL